MRCEEIQKRLNEAGSKTASLSDEIKEHLINCEACSRVAKSSVMLGNIFQAAKDESEPFLMPLEARMKLVVREAGSASWLTRLGEMAGRLIDAASFGHSRLAISSSLIGMLLILVTLVPFGYNRVVGYNLTIGNICPEVASDHEIVCALLYERGVEQMAIDLMACDTTCSLVLFDLKSEKEIELALATYKDLGADAIIENVAVVTDRESRTLLRMAREKIFSN